MQKSKYRPCRAPRQTRSCISGDGLWRVVGCVLLSGGLVLLFLCVPEWAWAALVGTALVCAGWALLSTCRR